MPNKKYTKNYHVNWKAQECRKPETEKYKTFIFNALVKFAGLHGSFYFCLPWFFFLLFCLQSAPFSIYIAMPCIFHLTRSFVLVVFISTTIFNMQIDSNVLPVFFCGVVVRLTSVAPLQNIIIITRRCSLILCYSYHFVKKKKDTKWHAFVLISANLVAAASWTGHRRFQVNSLRQ